MRKNIHSFIIYVALFCVGVTFGKLVDWGLFKLSNEISIIEALTLFTTIGLAIYITKVLEKETQDNRVKKDLYIAKISKLEENLSTFETLVEENNVLYSKINNRFHICRVKKNSIFKVLKNEFKKTNPNEIEKINYKMKSLKRLLTETKPEELSLKDNIANYSEGRKIKIYAEISNIEDIFFSMKVKINNF